MKALLLWYRLQSFRSKRDEFYRDLAEAFQRSEKLISFFEGEIENARTTKNGSRALALKMMLSRLQSGEQEGRLSWILGSVMPVSDSMMIAGVERATRKPEALRSLAEAVAHQRAMIRIMWKYSMLPLLMLPVCALLIKIMGDVILSIDKSTPDFVKAELWIGFNGAARWAAQVFADYGGWLLGAFVGLCLAIVVAMPRWTGRWRTRIDAWPVFGLYRDFQSGLLFSSLAMLLKAGSPLKAAVEDLAERTSGWMRWQLRRVLSIMEDRPNEMIEAFSAGVLSPHMLSRARTLHRSAQFSDVLVELGTKEAENVQKRVENAAILANIVVVGVLVAIATFMGMASLTVPGRFSTLMDPATLMALKQKQQLQSPQQVE